MNAPIAIYVRTHIVASAAIKREWAKKSRRLRLNAISFGMTRSPLAIESTGLTRRFGARTVVDALDLKIERGEVFGLLGHNGAGKTTTVRLLNGVLTADEGQTKVLGLDPIVDGPALRARVGVLSESPAVDPRLTGRENLEAYGQLFNMSRARAREQASTMLDRFGLADRGDDRSGEYSKGMKQRLALGRTLLHEPELLYLDEPTSGLDPLASHELHQHIEDLVKRGHSVVMCTHNLVEAQRLCHRVAVLQNGKKVLEGVPAELASQFPELARHQFEVHHEDIEEATTVIEGGGWTAVPSASAAIAPDHSSSVDAGAGLTVHGLERDDVPQLIASLTTAAVRVYGVVPEQASLEDIYLALHEPIQEHAPDPEAR